MLTAEHKVEGYSNVVALVLNANVSLVIFFHFCIEKFSEVRNALEVK